MLTSTALVLLMTLPGIALFYGGMVRKKSVLNTMASVVAIAALVTLLWFMGLGTLFVDAPIAHWVWEPGGWIAKSCALDFVGGSVVHINAGVAGLVCTYFLGQRRGYGREPFEPFNLGLTMAGARLLWVGWFGFNAGSAVASDGRAELAMLVTQIAAASAAVTWMFAEWVVRRRTSLLGLCSGLVAGLVAITPASGYVSPRAALAIGAISGIACCWGATGLKRLLKADDSLDVFGVHGIGGIVGCLLAGVTLFITGLRTDERSEIEGMDVSQHRERLGA